MYKLLTTAAVIMAVATPSFAWNGAKSLIEDLNTVYTGVDGQSQFNNLQGNGGELNGFLGDVNKGVTHISLTVGSDNNITATLNEGKSLTELETSASNLVNRVNFDLFHDTSPTNTDDNDAADDATGKYNSSNDYTSLAGFGIDQSIIESNVGHVGTGLDGADGNGLVGAKVNEIVTDTNTINTGLIDAVDIDGGKTAADQNKDFITAYNGGLNEEHFGVNTQTFANNISGINSSVNAASGASFFSDTSGFAIDGSTVGNFKIDGFVSGTDSQIPVTFTDGTNTYTSLLDWAQQN